MCICVCVSILRNADFISCEVCTGTRRNCPRQNGSHCTVPNASDLMYPSGRMVIKVNASSVIGFTTSDDFLTPDINYKGNVLHS